jgi:hypothetical protein
VLGDGGVPGGLDHDRRRGDQLLDALERARRAPGLPTTGQVTRERRAGDVAREEALAHRRADRPGADDSHGRNVRHPR